MTRRKLLFNVLGALAPAAAAYPTVFEPRFFELTSTIVPCGLSGGTPIRLLHLTDLHASQFVPMSMISHAIDIGLQQKPDLICLTGDFVTNKTGFNPDLYASVLRRLSQAAPTYAVLGNHDGHTWSRSNTSFVDHLQVERILSQSNIGLLHNQAETIRLQGKHFSLVGVGDLWSGEVDAPTAFSQLRDKGPVILLAHNPDTKELVADYPWNVMLSGHTHGGQVLVPFKGACFAPVKDRRYVAGLKRWGSRQIFVSRGVGNLGGIRFDCRPEVSLLTLA